MLGFEKLWRLMLNNILNFPSGVKNFIVIVADFLICFLSIWLSYFFKLGHFPNLNWETTTLFLYSSSLLFIIFFTTGMYKLVYRYSDASFLYSLALIIVVYGAVFNIVIFISHNGTVFLSVANMQPFILFTLLAAARIGVSLLLRPGRLAQRTRAMLGVYGVNESSRQIAELLRRTDEAKLVCFVDNSAEFSGRTVGGIPVFTLDQLIRSRDLLGITHLLLSSSGLSNQERAKLSSLMADNKIVIRDIPSVADLICGDSMVTELLELNASELLGRDSCEFSVATESDLLEGAVVLITGAGGSIGTELCRQTLLQKPHKILMLDISEYSLYSVNDELEKIRKVDSQLLASELIPILGSVTDALHVDEIMRLWKPSIVFHAAAYKHVPLVERNLIDGVQNNIFGTSVMAEAALKYDVDNFVLVSTDKAVRPTNAMGASKRIAELYLQAKHQLETDGGVNAPKTKFCMVRFGNVLASSGSVIPRFRQQILAGGPLTVTHPEVNRFFMTINEAAHLVIQAASLSHGGEVFVLDMGKPIKIMDLARRMIYLSGMSIKDDDNPQGDIEIKVIGLRPGEKLYEELLLGDSPVPTQNPKILKARDPSICWDLLSDQLNQLQTHLTRRNAKGVMHVFENLVDGFENKSGLLDWAFLEERRLRENSGNS